MFSSNPSIWKSRTVSHDGSTIHVVQPLEHSLYFLAWFESVIDLSVTQVLKLFAIAWTRLSNPRKMDAHRRITLQAICWALWQCLSVTDAFKYVIYPLKTSKWRAYIYSPQGLCICTKHFCPLLLCVHN